jgi:hypothetical protein
MAFMARHCGRFHVLWEPATVADVRLWPCHVWNNLEGTKGEKMDGGVLNVLVAHQSLTNKKKMFDVVSTADYGVGCPYRLVLSGHMHDGYDVHDVDGTTFCNPGGMARRAIDEIGRMPQVAVVEGEAGGSLSVELVGLRSARPGAQVFGEGVAEVAREMDGFDPTAFVSDIEKFEVSSVDVFDLVRQAGRKEGVRDEVLAYIEGKRR